MKTKSNKEMGKEIREKYEGVPEMQVSAGIYIHTIGYKYVTLLNTWETTRFEKIEIEEFYNNYVDR